MLQTFKQYLNENRNKTRQKELKFINYYLNLYLKDTQQMIEDIYQQEIISSDVLEGESGNENYAKTNKGIGFSSI